MIDSAANGLGKGIEKRTIWMCPECGVYYEDEPGCCRDCGRKLVKRHVWICPNRWCGVSYPGNRRPPEHCEECGTTLRGE